MVDTQATKKPKAEPVSRETLWTGGIVQFTLNGKGALVKSKHVKTPYFMTQRGVSGGTVQIFFYAGDIETRTFEKGDVVRCQVELCAKTMSDGRRLLYVNAHIVSDDTPLTHELVIHPVIGLVKSNTVRTVLIPGTKGYIDILTVADPKKADEPKS